MLNMAVLVLRFPIPSPHCRMFIPPAPEFLRSLDYFTHSTFKLRIAVIIPSLWTTWKSEWWVAQCASLYYR